MADYKCENCGSEKVRLNCCMYWTVSENTDPKTLNVDNCDDGIHVNGYFCDECEHCEMF